jgi:type 1 glutamine amidotransferase
LVEKIKILLLCAGDNQYHDHVKIGFELKKNLSIQNFDVFLTDDFNLLLPENIKRYDTIVSYSVGAKTSNDNINSLLNAVSGTNLNYKGNPVGFVGIHGATTSFQDNEEYKKMIGASFITHPDFGPIYYFKVNKDHAITKNIDDFQLPDELYLFTIHSDFNTLISCNYEDIVRPIAWYKYYRKGRIFYLALGHGIEQINNPILKELIINGINWTSFILS